LKRGTRASAAGLPSDMVLLGVAMVVAIQILMLELESSVDGLMF
jgi:hypothetical protein